MMLTTGRGDVRHSHKSLHHRHEADTAGIASNPERMPSGRTVRQPESRQCTRHRRAASAVTQREARARY